MTDLGPVARPPVPIRADRLVLRESEARDRAAFIELLASPQVHTYLGGPHRREELERELPEVPERWPGSFVVELDGTMIGQILLRTAPEHSRPASAGKADLGYMFLPRDLPGDTLVVLFRDAEGNLFSPLSTYGFSRYAPTHGEFVGDV